MNWTRTEDVIKELRLTSDPHDYDALRKELRTRLAELHPDKNGGAFADKEAEKQYNSISSAYEFVNRASEDSIALIPVTQLPAIIKAVREAQVAPSQTQINTLKTECRAESRAISHDRYILPKIGSGTFAAICAFFFTFSGSLSEHPLLGTIAKNRSVQIGLLVATLYAAIFFIMTWMREKREETKIEWLLSERGRREIFDALLRNARHPVSGNKMGRFTARNVADVMMQESGFRMRSAFFGLASVLFSRGRMSISIAEKIAEVHLMELEKRGAIRRIEDPSIEAVFEFDYTLMRASVDE